MSMKSIPHLTPMLYNKSGVYWGIQVFLIFDPKHRLWIRVGEAVLTHNQCFELNIKNIFFFSMQFSSIFTAEKISVYCTGKFSCNA